MENEKNTNKHFEPEIEIVLFTEKDIITASDDWEGEDHEAEIMPVG